MTARLSSILILISFLIGLVVSLSWIAQIHFILNLNPNYVTMKMTTSLLFIMSSIILFLNHYNVKRWIGITQGFLICLSFLIIITQLMAGLNGERSFLDTWSINDPDLKSLIPGRPSLETKINFSFFMVGNVFQDVRGGIGFIIGASGAVGLLGYFLNIPIFYGFTDTSSAMALHTCIGFICLGLACIFFKKEKI